MSRKIKDTNKLVFKIITLGNAGVGKTSIINRYIEKNFDPNSLATIGMEFAVKTIKLNNQKTINLKIIDTGGQEKFKSLCTSYIKNTDGVFFVFALNNKESFFQITNWIEIFKQNHSGKDKIPTYLVGNKCDLLNNIEVDENLIEDFKKNYEDMIYFETSAKDNINIEKIFEEMGEKLYVEYLKSGRATNTQIKVKMESKKKKKKNCCEIEPDY